MRTPEQTERGPGDRVRAKEKARDLEDSDVTMEDTSSGAAASPAAPAAALAQQKSRANEADSSTTVAAEISKPSKVPNSPVPARKPVVGNALVQSLDETALVQLFLDLAGSTLGSAAQALPRLLQVFPSEAPAIH